MQSSAAINPQITAPRFLSLGLSSENATFSHTDGAALLACTLACRSSSAIRACRSCWMTCRWGFERQESTCISHVTRTTHRTPSRPRPKIHPRPTCNVHSMGLLRVLAGSTRKVYTRALACHRERVSYKVDVLHAPSSPRAPRLHPAPPRHLHLYPSHPRDGELLEVEAQLLLAELPARRHSHEPRTGAVRQALGER
jgi:hypothetical protein